MRAVDEAAAALLGATVDALLGRVVWEVIPEFVGTALHHRLMRSQSDGVTASFRAPAPPLARPCEVRCEPMRDGVRLALVPAPDIPMATAAARTVAAGDPYRAVFEAAPDAILLLDASCRVVEANAAAQHLLPLEASPFLETLVADAAEGAQLQADLLAGEALAQREVRLRRADGSSADCLATGGPHTAAGGAVAGYQVILHEVMAPTADEAARRGAFHDPLTGLPNRALFLDRLGHVMKHARRRQGYRYGVLFVDLDRFKQVNDTYGHQAGDEVLETVARRLETCIRQEDTAGRLGGDEFAVLLDAIADVGSATLVTERILEELARPCRVAGRELQISASVGIALSMTGYESADAILHDADTAMYRAKTGGRNRYEIFDTGMQERARREQRLETELREALRRAEFALHYQPVVALEGGAVTGMEALVRWSHPSRGTLLPAEFMAVAEKSGLVVELGWWVLREACEQLRRWQEGFPETTLRLTMSVNLSARQFGQPDLVQVVDSILHETGIDPACLHLEMPEAAVTQDRDAALRVLGQLFERGIRLGIDDFGTGPSSLAELRRLPISSVKIDRSFIGTLDNGAPERALVRTIVALGEHLSIDTVAEGVETPGQLAELRALGARFAQGFLFSLPLEAQAAGALLAPQTPPPSPN